MRIFENLVFLTYVKGGTWMSMPEPCFIPNYKLSGFNARFFDPMDECSRADDKIRECYDLCLNNENGHASGKPKMPECTTLNCSCGEHRNVVNIERLSPAVKYHFGSMSGSGSMYGDTDYEIYNANCKAVPIPKLTCSDVIQEYNFVSKTNSRRKCIIGRDYKILGYNGIGK